MMSLFDLAGCWAIVTGAYRHRLAIAIGLAQAGADIVGVGRSAMDETADAVTSTGRRFVSPGGPVRYRGGEGRYRTRPCRRRLARISSSTMQNSPPRRRGLEFTEEDWDAVLDTNLKSVFFLCQAFAKAALARQAPAKIVNIASLLSFQGGIRIPSYTASKSGLAGITRLMANEWASKASTSMPSPSVMSRPTIPRRFAPMRRTKRRYLEAHSARPLGEGRRI